MAKNKTIKTGKVPQKKEVTTTPKSSQGEKVIWCFDNIDRDGQFAFNPARPDFKAQLILEKLISYSSMTWGEVVKQTHDEKGKSKKEAEQSVAKKVIEELEIANDF